MQGSDFSLQGLVSHLGWLYPLVWRFPKHASGGEAPRVQWTVG